MYRILELYVFYIDTLNCLSEPNNPKCKSLSPSLSVVV